MTAEFVLTFCLVLLVMTMSGLHGMTLVDELDRGEKPSLPWELLIASLLAAFISTIEGHFIAWHEVFIFYGFGFSATFLAKKFLWYWVVFHHKQMPEPEIAYPIEDPYDEFRPSLNRDLEKYLGMTPEEQEEADLDMVKRRMKAHELDLRLSERESLWRIRSNLSTSVKLYGEFRGINFDSFDQLKYLELVDEVLELSSLARLKGIYPDQLLIAVAGIVAEKSVYRRKALHLGVKFARSGSALRDSYTEEMAESDIREMLQEYFILKL